MKFYFIRHGEIESNRQLVYAGWSEEGLTVTGIEQARAAGHRFENHGIGAIYCSPLQRTRQTAEIVGEILAISPEAMDNFKELNYGPWEGKSEKEVISRYPAAWQTWNTRPAELVLPGRETIRELQDRVIQGLELIKSKRGGMEKVLIVTHVAIIRVALLHAGSRDLNLYRTIPVANAEIFEINL